MGRREALAPLWATERAAYLALGLAHDLSRILRHAALDSVGELDLLYGDQTRIAGVGEPSLDAP